MLKSNSSIYNLIKLMTIAFNDVNLQYKTMRISTTKVQIIIAAHMWSLNAFKSWGYFRHPSCIITIFKQHFVVNKIAPAQENIAVVACSEWLQVARKYNGNRQAAQIISTVHLILCNGTLITITLWKTRCEHLCLSAWTNKQNVGLFSSGCFYAEITLVSILLHL